MLRTYLENDKKEKSVRADWPYSILKYTRKASNEQSR